MSTEQRQVLIIEDDETLRDLYAMVLQTANITSLCAGTGEKGLALALKNHPDLLLVDVMLPDISGHEVVKRLRLDDWGKNAKVIFLTNRTDAESVVEAVESGSEEYLVKAHTENQDLLNKIRTAMAA